MSNLQVDKWICMNCHKTCAHVAAHCCKLREVDKLVRGKYQDNLEPWLREPWLMPFAM